MKRFSIRGLLFVLLLFCSAPTWAQEGIYDLREIPDFSAENDDGVTIYYYFINGTENEVGVTGKSTEEDDDNPSYTGKVVIPSSVKHDGTTYNVTRIGPYAMVESDKHILLTSVVIPSSVTRIEEWAFFCCLGLTSVTYGDNSQLTYIGDGAFYDCQYLTSIEIPAGVSYIGSDAFNGEHLVDDIGYIISPGLVTVICHCLTPPTLGKSGGGDVFDVDILRYFIEENSSYVQEYINNGGRTTTLLRVPEDAGVAYANTAGWNVFDVMLEDTVTITPDAQDGDYYYGTRFSPYSYTLQEGEEGAIISANGISADDDGGTLNLSWDYQSGDVVPANTALLIRSATLTSYANPVVEATDDEVNNTTTDLLCGNVKDGVGYWSTYDTETGQTTKKDVTTYVSYDNEADPADYYFYKLTYGADGTANADVLGFYWATHSQTNSEEDGAPFTVNGKHAWLAIPKSTFNNLETASLPLNKMETTGIKVVDTTETATDAIYNLQGMRLSDMSRKGLYIVNGTKVIKK